MGNNQGGVMEYYKVLLVDDEEDVRESIVRKLDWASLGFAVVGQAGNGVEALELAERLEPDIVMTDIKMPFMDGLELCRRVKRFLPGVHVAIFSGFDEFEYAKEAITQQVEEYILKPIDAEELASVFRRLRATLDAEIAERRDMERLRHYYAQSLPLLRQQVLIELLERRIEAGDIPGRFAGYDLDIAAREYCVATVQYWHGDEQTVEGRLLEVSLCRLIGDVLGSSVRYHLVQRLDRIVLLFLLDGGGAAQVTELLGQLFALSRRLLNVRLSIGVGSARARPDEIALSYEESCSALEYKLLVEQGQCICIGDIEPGAGSSEAPDPQYAEELLRCIKVGTQQELQKAVSALTGYLSAMHTGVQQSRIYLLELFAELLKLIRTYRMDAAEAGQDSLLQEGMTLPFSDMDAFGEWLAAYCERLRQLARRERKDSVRLLIDRAAGLLQERYADSELSLEVVCAELGVSAAYMSTVFKKETGQGFVSFLTELRMDKALELLAGTDLKTYQIAERIGYTDPNYFSYVFKKKFGMSPSKYKADRMSAHEPTNHLD